MATNLILNTTDDLATIRAIVDIAASMDAGRFDGFITQAQEIDLRAQLGADFYTWVNTESGEGSPDASYTAILPYLQKILIFYTYARYLERGGVMASRTGGKVFGDERAVQLTTGQLTLAIASARKDAESYVAQMATFIDDSGDSDYSDFTQYTNRKRGGIQIRAI